MCKVGNWLGGSIVPVGIQLWEQDLPPGPEYATVCGSISKPDGGRGVMYRKNIDILRSSPMHLWSLIVYIDVTDTQAGIYRQSGYRRLGQPKPFPDLHICCDGADKPAENLTWRK